MRPFRLRRLAALVIAASAITACGGERDAAAERTTAQRRVIRDDALPPDAPRYEMFVLGRMQDGGLPHFGCERACCTAARRDGRREGPVSLGLHDRTAGSLWLVEATPAVETQVARLHTLAGVSGRGRQPVDGVLLTHAHIGHYLGLAHFGREVASTNNLPIHATPRMAEFLRSHGPWKQLVELGQITPRELPPGEEVELAPGLFATPVKVPHRDEFSDTVAFRLRGPGATVVFCPDVDRWDVDPTLLDRLLDGVDIAYLDGTFYGDPDELPGRDLAEIPHPPMRDTMDRLAERAAEHPGSIRFLHLNHTNPALRDDAIRTAIEQRGFRIAEVGERVTL